MRVYLSKIVLMSHRGDLWTIPPTETAVADKNMEINGDRILCLPDRRNFNAVREPVQL
jgi:hypothetical protein